jgi:hypothetical protein
MLSKNLPKSGIEAKLLIEPTAPKPGPTLPIVAADAENEVKVSIPIAESNTAVIKTITI